MCCASRWIRDHHRNRDGRVASGDARRRRLEKVPGRASAGCTSTRSRQRDIDWQPASVGKVAKDDGEDTAISNLSVIAHVIDRAVSKRRQRNELRKRRGRA